MTQLLSSPPATVDYPESDGLPMADNTKQFWWIQVIAGNLAAMYRHQADVFVGGNLFWYPVEGHPEIVAAPDDFVVFGRPKGHRRSYRQWEEGNVALTVVVEVLSPKNTVLEMARKLAFYDKHGVEEYYVYDPEANTLLVYLRRGGKLELQPQFDSFVSPRLGIRFDLSGDEMVIYRPDNQRFLTFEQLDEIRLLVETRVVEARQRAEHAERQMARLALLSRKVRQGSATPEETTELEQLEQTPPS
jgi:Uma2 family endonuclease